MCKLSHSAFKSLKIQDAMTKLAYNLGRASAEEFYNSQRAELKLLRNKSCLLIVIPEFCFAGMPLNTSS